MGSISRVGGALAVAACVGMFGATVGAAPDKLAGARKKYEAAVRKNTFEIGKAHIELGLWARDAGLPVQSTAEFLRAEELAGDEMPIAGKIVAIMRAYGDKFWKSVQKHPVALLRTYESKADKIEADGLKDRLRLAKDAASWGLEEESFAEYLAAVRLVDAPLAFDAKEQLILPTGLLEPAISARIKAAAISINEKLYVRDEVLALVPEMKEISEADGPRVRVRTQGGAKEAEDVLAIVTALLPALEADLDGRPTRKMQIFVFKEKKQYLTFLKATKQERYEVATGLADGATNTALVNAEGLSPDTVRRVAMHEVAHLFMYGVTPAVMPSWYAEGFADTYGGTGTFTWDGKALVAGGPLEKSLVASVQGDDGFLPLAELTAGDALALLSKDRPRATRFYVESWAFLRFLRTAAPADLRDRFRLFELACRGGAVGAKAGKARERDTAPGREAFAKAFGADLPALEKAFRGWLATL